MGKRRFNEKGRKIVETIIDDSTTKKIKLELPASETTEYANYDESNALVLPSQKRKTKIQSDTTHHVTRILSKKQRKKLEKIVDKKKKKEGRSSLLDKLAGVQLPADELQKYTSITHVQTVGLRKHLLEKRPKRSVDTSVIKEIKNEKATTAINRVDLLRGYKRNNDVHETITKEKNYNIIGTEMSSSDEEDEEADNSDDGDNVTDEKDAPKTTCDTNEPIDGSVKIEENQVIETIKVEKEEEKKELNENQHQSKDPISHKRVVYIHVDRDQSIQAARLKLPILGEEQVIMETINENTITILAGETGSGKTTQVPQFLYEAGYAERKQIGITEPRRVAAISMSKRVATEMNVSNDIVSYLIRFEGNVTEQTKIKFMTDGVLLKEIENDFILSKYSVIILDEAHERSVYTDILVGLLSRIVQLRRKRADPLKLIIMSATLRIDDFTKNSNLFQIPPPVISVETRQFPVTVHFNKRTADDYVKEAFNKTLKIHTKLPEGGILIFLTGQHEVNHLIRKLRKACPFRKQNSRNKKDKKQTENARAEDDFEEFDMKKAIKMSKRAKKNLHSQVEFPTIDLDNYKLPSDDTDADLFDNSTAQDDDIGEFSSDDEADLSLVGLRNCQPLWVLPLYSLLPSEQQAKVFEPPPDGTRLCVVSTNVAETSLTIPNIKYVVDSGRQKTRLYDKVTGVTSFVVTFTSKASANQRAGRAGRTAPGHCYRLYSSALYNDEFENFAMPDIQKKPVDDLMLQMKCMGIDRVVNFPFPSPPNPLQLTTAENKLKLLGALESSKTAKGEELSTVTALGRAISAFPVAPRFGKMLALSHQHNLLPYTVCMVAALSVQEVLQEFKIDGEEYVQTKQWYNKRRSWAGTGHSLLLGDPVVLLRAVGAAEYAGSLGKLTEFCTDNGLRPKAISEIRKLRVQLTNEINLSMPDVNLAIDPKMQPPTDTQAKLLRQIILAGMGDQVARKVSVDELNDKDDKIKYKYAYRCPEMEEPVFMHSSSVLRKTMPEWVVYQEVYETQCGDSRKMFMRGITAIEPEWLLMFVRPMCNIRSIKEDPMPRYNKKDGKIYCFVEATFGKSGWTIPFGEIEMPLSELACRYFAMFLLSGEVCPKLKVYVKQLRSSPKNVIKSWSKNLPHVVGFVNKLISQQVTTKSKLLSVWKTNSYFLIHEFCDFLTEAGLSDVMLNWPPVN